VPSTAEAALVLLVLFMPGLLALRGYTKGRPNIPVGEGLPGLGRAVTVSIFIDLVAWKFGGSELYRNAREGTALSQHEGETFRFAVGLATLPALVGFLAGELVDTMAERVARARADLGAATEEEGTLTRQRRRALGTVGDRLLAGGPTTWERTWAAVRRKEPWVYVRVRMKSGDELVGTMDNQSRVAASPQPGTSTSRRSSDRSRTIQQAVTTRRSTARGHSSAGTRSRALSLSPTKGS
jgi:hypothetical protein